MWRMSEALSIRNIESIFMHWNLLERRKNLTINHALAA